MKFGHFLAAVFVIVLWATNLLVLKAMCTNIPLELFNCLRFVACLPLLLFFRKPPSHLTKLMLVALFWNASSLFFIGLGLRHGAGAGVVSVVYQTCSFFGLLFCFLLSKERPKMYQIIGMIVSFLGIILLFSHTIHSGLSIMGPFYILCAAMSWGLGLALIKKYRISPDLSTSVWLAAVSALPMAVLTYTLCEYSAIESVLRGISMQLIFGILFAAYGSTLLAGCIWFWLLKHYESASVAPFMLLLPVLTCLMSYVFLGEQFTRLQCLSFFIIVLGFSINLNVFKPEMVGYLYFGKKKSKKPTLIN
jgi:O-acetylserine/cysteine efflux transporter